MLRTVPDKLFKIVGDESKRNPSETYAVKKPRCYLDPESAVCATDAKITAESAWNIQSPSNPNHKIVWDAVGRTFYSRPYLCA